MDTFPNESTSSDVPVKNQRQSVFLCAAVVLLGLFYFLISAPFSSTPMTIHIGSRESVLDISTELYNRNVIRYPKIFRGFVSLLSSHSVQIAVGDYYIEQSTPVWKVAWMISHGVHNITPIKVTFPEGTTNIQMSDVLAKRIPNFDQAVFEKQVAEKQGYLFPDTYFFYPLSTTDEIVTTLSSNFTKHLKILQKENPRTKYTVGDSVRMAAILEREGRPSDADMIAGILWKRIKLGMPLQVDAAPDTYKTKGLPEEPIANPGIIMLGAAMNPKESFYLYYLHDKKGMVHFADTYAAHKRNIALYLK